MPQQAEKMNAILRRLEPTIVDGFRHLHMNPELSFEEHQTTRYIKDTLTVLGLEIIDIGLETGLVALLKGRGDGPCVALRADIDGLPIQELTDCPHQSRVPGVMHACGHDTHAASLLGAARVLAEMRDEIQGSVKFLFQPAEERNQGAKLMIKHGALKSPDVDVIFGLHNNPYQPVGEIGVKVGGLMAAVDRFYITVKGRGGHGGVPQLTIDPVVAGAGMITALQHIVSRRIDPKETCVLSVCSLQAGAGLTYNVIPEEVKMAGTTRSYAPSVGAALEPLMRQVIEGVAAAHACTAELEYIYDQPAVINPASLHPVALASVTDVRTSFGQTVSADPTPSTGGEDFTFFMREVPGFFYWLGVGSPGAETVHPWHSPHFLADQRAIAIGAGVYAASVFRAIEALENGTVFSI